MNIRDAIISQLRQTGRENIENVISYMDRHGFFVRHCHRHHRYVGGLADHAWQTFLLAQRSAPATLSLDSLAIATLLHDLCDCSGMSRFKKGHGSRSDRMLRELGLHLTQEEFLAIRFHMSLRKKASHFLYEEALHCSLRRVVHNADGQSARLHRGYGLPVK